MPDRTTKSGVFVEEQYGARVATIREGNNGVEMQDNRDGTVDLTIDWYDEERGLWDDLTASKMKRDDLMALRRAIDGFLTHETPKTEAMMNEERMRKIGVASGMVHALVMLKRDICQRTYHPIPPHHTRQVRERQMQVATLRDIYKRLEGDLRRLQAAINE